jgi:hypothetical protein
LNFMATFMLQFLTLFVALWHGSITCSVITIYFIIDTSFIGLTSCILTRLMMIMF